MTGIRDYTINRRTMLVGGGAIGAMLLLPGCAGGGGDELGGLAGGIGGMGAAFSLADVLRRLLTRASQNAFARLTVADDFWDEHMAQLDLAERLGNGGNALSRMLASGPFKAQIEHQFAILAADASTRAVPLVQRASRNILTSDATQLLRKKPGAATDFLRKEMGGALLNVIEPSVGAGLREARDQELGPLLGPLTGGQVDPDDIAAWLGPQIEETIWNEIAAEERAIRADPRSTRDLLLIRVFGNG